MRKQTIGENNTKVEKKSLKYNFGKRKNKQKRKDKNRSRKRKYF